MTNVTYLASYTKQRFNDNQGNALAGGLLTTYGAGTTTQIATYVDATGTTQNTNPIVLNSRGEANIYLLPNVGYKFALTDANGNQIPGWPIDNIINASLLSLYAGVDSGAVNAYILTVSLPVPANTQGNVFYWLASNTNTGAATLNVNGTGTIPILNPNGSALTAGQIVAGQMTQVIYNNGVWVLTSIGALAGIGTGTFATEVAIASASTTDLGSTGSHVVNVTGASTINSFGTSASVAAPIYSVRFSGTPTINVGGSLITPTGSNIAVSAGDACLAQYQGSGTWKILIYQATGNATAYAVKKTQTSRASVTAVSADPDLQLTLGTGTYILQGWLNDAGSTSAGGLSGTFVFSGSSTVANWAANGVGGGFTSVPLNAITGSATAQELQSAQSGTASITINGVVQSTAGGTLSFQWAQHASNATASVLSAGSWIEATLLSASSGSFVPVTHSYTSGSGTETIPTGATTLTIEGWGGSGAGGATGPGEIGGGGGSASYFRSTYTVSGDGGQTLNYAVGAGGTPTSGVGGNGGNTSVTSGTFAVTAMTAFGGTGGQAPGSGAGGVVATGGTAANTAGNAGQAGGTGSGNGGAGLVGINGTGAAGGNGQTNFGSAGGAGLIVFRYV